MKETERMKEALKAARESVPAYMRPMVVPALDKIGIEIVGTVGRLESRIEELERGTERGTNGKATE